MVHSGLSERFFILSFSNIPFSLNVLRIMTFGFYTHSSFLTFVIIRSLDIDLNRHFIDNYSVVFCKYGTFRLVGMYHIQRFHLR